MNNSANDRRGAVISAGFGLAGQISDVFWRKPVILLLLMLTPPLLWLGVVYIGSLLALLAQSFFSIDEFSGLINYHLTLKTYGELLNPANLDIILRTVSMAAIVTLASVIVAFPVAFYAARYARGRWKALFYLGVMLPLWSSYLVKIYAWKLILAKEGIRTDPPQMATGCLSGDPDDRWKFAFGQLYRHVSGLPLRVVALHGPAHAGSPGAGSGQLSGGILRSWRHALADLSQCAFAPGLARCDSRIDFYIFTHPW